MLTKVDETRFSDDLYVCDSIPESYSDSCNRQALHPTLSVVQLLTQDVLELVSCDLSFPIVSWARFRERFFAAGFI